VQFDVLSQNSFDRPDLIDDNIHRVDDVRVLRIMRSVSDGRGAVSDYPTALLSSANVSNPGLAAATSVDGRDEYDELIGLTFRTMREHVGASQAALAQHLGISEHVVEALEAGSAVGLPDRAEIQRVVAGYAHMVQADLTPIESRLLRHVEVSQARIVPAGVAVAPTLKAAGTPPKNVAKRRTKSVWRKRALALGLPIVAALGVATTAQTSPQSLFAAVNTFPDSLRPFAYAGLNMMTPVKSHRADGLLWIEASDPRTRKADRLPGRR
jgi:DNA-binding XRE family transcriptional regulator